MLYRFLRPITRFFLKAYFRKIFIDGITNIPADGPVILVSNHPTAFMEPCLLACFLPRELYFLVRADLFKKPILSKILYGTNQLPIYRFRDGIKELRNSHTIINRTIDNVAKGNALLIFPEASTTEVRHLRPIKKGAARMALDTLKLYPETKLKIIPIGLNYSSPNRFRSIVSIKIGKAIVPSLPSDEKQIPKEIHKLTKEIQEGLEAQVLHLEDVENAPLLDDLVKLRFASKKVKYLPIVEYDSRTYFDGMKDLSERLNQGSENLDSKRISDWGQGAEGYEFRYLEASKNMPLKVIGALLILPFVAIFLLLNLLPALVGKILERKYVREREFHASVLIAATMGAYILFFTLVLIVALILFGWYGLLVVFLPIAGLIGLLGFDFVKQVFLEIQDFRNLRKSKKEALFNEALLILEKF